MTIPAIDWRKLDMKALDLGYDNANAVAGSAEIAQGWLARSAALRAAHPAHLDLTYGPRPRNRTDFLKAADGAQTLVFIHGGYWQRRAKEDFTFVAAGPLAHGINVALMGYTLAPDATLDEMTLEIRTGLDHLMAALPGLGADPSGIYLSGWSAGGHLAAMTLDHPGVKAALAISGLYDLEPIEHVSVNAALRLDTAAARRNSPAHLPPRGTVPLTLVAGSGELPMMRAQTADFAAQRCRHALPTVYEEIDGGDHFTVLDAMEAPDGRITTLIRQMIG